MESERCQLFNCHMCGMCCRNIKHYKEEVYPVLKKVLDDKLPEFTIEDNSGICVNLTNDNKCAIYETRPILCNTNKMFEMLSPVLRLSIDELYQLQRLSCLKNKNIKY